MQTGYFDLGDGKLYYEVEGEDQQETLILSHAAFLDSRMWDGQWEAFAQHYRVIRYDMIGYGKSDLATGPRTRRQDLYCLLQHLGVQRAHLLGCSMGGEIVLDLALEHPELAASLIIINSTPSGFELQGEPPPYFFEMIAATQQGNIDLASELQLRIWVDGPQRQPEQINPTVRQRASVMNRIFVANGTWAIAEPSNPLTPPAVGRLDEVQVPTLLITGARDHAEVLRAAQMMATEISKAKLVSIPETAHVPNMEVPVMFNQAVLAFLAGVRG